MNFFKKSNFLFVSSIILFIIMVLNFSNNFLKIVDINWFNTWQLDSEWCVRQRMLDDANFGFSYNAGLLGATSPSDWINESYHEDHKAYTAQVGLQGLFFGICYKITNSVKFCHIITAFLNVLCIFTILFWIYKEFSFFTSLITYVILLFNQWLIVSGRNLYWVIGTLLVPMLVTLYFLYFEEKGKKYNIIYLYVFAFISIFVRASCGFEFISVAMINLELPLFYYAVKNNWGFKKFFKRFFVLSIMAIGGFLFSLIICLIQNSFYFDSFSLAIRQITDRLGYRLGIGELSFFDKNIVESLSKSKWDVFRLYLFEGVPLVFFLRLKNFLIIYVFSFFSSVIGIHKYDEDIKKKCMCLHFLTLLSFLGPLSWYILASAHSYIHRHINYLIISTPFLIFVCSDFIYSLYGFAKFNIDFSFVYTKLKKYFLLVVFGFFFFFVFVLYFVINHYNSNYKKLLRIEKLENVFNSDKIKISLYENSLYYFISSHNDNSKRFFLHYLTDDVVGQPLGFVNGDFDFNQKKVKIPFWSKRKVIKVDIPISFKIKGIETGQFEEDKRFWNVSLPYSTITNFELLDLTDDNWNHGISRFNDSKILLVKSENLAYKTLVGKTIKINDLITANVLQVNYVDGYCHILIDKSMFNTSDKNIVLVME